MKQSVINAGKWMVGLKWWQMLILYPAIFGVLLSTVQSGYSFIYHDVMGNPHMSAIAKRNADEFEKHFGENPAKKEVIELNGSRIEFAYYKSDSCMLVTRRMGNGNLSMIWLPLSEKELVTFTDARDFSLISEAYAGDTQQQKQVQHKLYHEKYEDRILEIQKAYILVERVFEDGCVGHWKFDIEAGEGCCWEWVIFNHKADE